MLVDTDRVVDQFAARRFEQRRDLAVDQRGRQNRHGHQREGEKRARSAITEEHGIPITHIREHAAGGHRVDEYEFEAFLQTGTGRCRRRRLRLRMLRLCVFRHAYLRTTEDRRIGRHHCRRYSSPMQESIDLPETKRQV